MRIRPAEKKDLRQIQQLFFDTVNTINARDYSRIQITAWAAGYNDDDRWGSRIAGQHFRVAVKDNVVVGFASLTNVGHVDLLYVHKDYQRQGVATCLFKELDRLAKESGMQELTADVSITARPFFEKQGFEVVFEQVVNVRGTKLSNYKMLRPNKVSSK